jgi:hypothetical protein
MRVEGEMAEDYLRSKQSGQRREQDDLKRRSLHEWELECIECVHRGVPLK